MAVEHMLTTVDNPYNPFTHFDEWYAWDTFAGYHTLQYLARIMVPGMSLSEADESEAIEMAIREIVEENVFGMHVAITADEVPRAATTSV